MKTAELTRAMLDYWAGKAEGKKVNISNGACFAQLSGRKNDIGMYCPTTNWAQGGPIIEREGVTIVCESIGVEWSASTNEMDDDYFKGPTALIAAMRAYVASKFGEEVPDDAQCDPPPIRTPR